jgi:hypothetical protein
VSVGLKISGPMIRGRAENGDLQQRHVMSGQGQVTVILDAEACTHSQQDLAAQSRQTWVRNSDTGTGRLNPKGKKMAKPSSSIKLTYLYAEGFLSAQSPNPPTWNSRGRMHRGTLAAGPESQG